MNLKFFDIIGIFLLFLGLMWLNVGELIEHEIINKEKSETNELDNNSNINNNLNVKILFYSLLGLFPTVLGIYLIEYSNRKKKKLITMAGNK
ncbi:MAG: hypothetical protein AABW90_00345 [Nanoarchaeota archaeon]